MGVRSKRIMLLALLWSLCLLLCGCRTRTNGSSEILLPDTDESQADEGKRGEVFSEDADLTENGDSGENDSQTKENPEAARKEYDENAPAEIALGTDHLLHQTGEGNGASVANEEAGICASQLNDQAEETATQTVAADEAEQMGVSEAAEAAESALTYFTVLLKDKMGLLFECQRLNVYWETVQDHVTIHKNSPEHALILNAGCYDVSGRLLPENVDGGVPGNERAAKETVASLRSREGWAAIDAVKNRRILLLSEDLLQAPYLQTAAMVIIAKTANPDLFMDVDLDDMLQMLMEEATGMLLTEVYYYSGN